MSDDIPDEIKAEIHSLRDALAFYAQSSNWQRGVAHVGLRVRWEMPQAHRDKGARARIALTRSSKK